MSHVSKFPLPVDRSSSPIVVTKKQAVLLLATAWATGVASCNFILLVIKGVAL